MGFNACNVMSVDPKSVLEKAFGDSLAAIGGILANLRPFVQADLRDARAFGILQGPAPVTIVDPMLENTVAYSLDKALKFAIKVAPALTVDLHTQNQLTQLCIIVSCRAKASMSWGTRLLRKGKYYCWP